jgi:hypothetical protein
MFQPALPLSKTAQKLRWVVLVASMALILAAYGAAAIDLPHRKCWFQTLVGFPGPGCGLTRSWMAIARGDFSQAFSFHLFGPLLFGSLLWLSTHVAVELTTGKGIITPYTRWLAQPRSLAYGSLCIGALFLTYYLLRLFIRFHEISLPWLSHLELWQSLVTGAQAL